MQKLPSNNENNKINRLGLEVDPTFNLEGHVKNLIEEATTKAEEKFDIQKWFKNNPLHKQHHIVLKFKNESTNPDPMYSTVGSSGFDLRANLNDVMTLAVGDYAMVPTGLFFEIPEGFEIQIRPRSGLAAKKGVTVLNSPGTIDWDYRGEIKIILINHGSEAFIIKHGDRIAQAVMSAVTAKNVVKLQRVDEILKNTDRNTDGFGSTGKN